MHGTLQAGLGLAAALLFAAPAQAQLCVAVADDRADVRKAADAAAGALPSALRLDLREPAGRDQLARCAGVVAVGPAGLKAALAGVKEKPVVATLVPNPGPPGVVGGPAAAVLPEAAPDEVLALLAQLAPGVRRVAVVFNPANTGALVARAKVAASERGLELVALEATDLAAAIRAFHGLEKDASVHALWILPDRTTTTYETAHQAVKLAAWKRIPVVGPSRTFVTMGALFAVEPRPDEQGRLAAKHLQALAASGGGGQQLHAPGTLVVNQRTVDRLELRIPDELRARITELIQ